MLAQDEEAILMADKTQADPTDASSDRLESLDQLAGFDWELLLERIRLGRCTPFIGSEACLGTKQFRSEIVKEWVQRYKNDYPFAYVDDLPRAAQFVAVKQKDSFAAKDEVAKKMREAPPRDDLEDSQKLFRVLAELPFPVYITTNYHDRMEQVLKSLPNPKDVRKEFCRWNPNLQDIPSVFGEEPSYNPDAANPLVFHLYGDMSVSESLVLTEDDYFDFLIAVSEDENLIPPRIHRWLTNASLLFLGYRVYDWDFRVLFRIVAKFLRKNLIGGRRLHVAVQMETIEERAQVVEEQRIKDYLTRYFKSFDIHQMETIEERIQDVEEQRIKDYLTRYFEAFDIQVYWVSCQEFAAELLKRWHKKHS